MLICTYLHCLSANQPLLPSAGLSAHIGSQRLCSRYVQFRERNLANIDDHGRYFANSEAASCWPRAGFLCLRRRMMPGKSV